MIDLIFAAIDVAENYRRIISAIVLSLIMMIYYEPTLICSSDDIKHQKSSALFTGGVSLIALFFQMFIVFKAKGHRLVRAVVTAISLFSSTIYGIYLYRLSDEEYRKKYM